LVTGATGFVGYHTTRALLAAGRDAQRVFATNVTGARTVLGEALEHGVTLAIHVSSVTALYNPRAERLDHTSAPAGGGANWQVGKLARHTPR